MLPAGRSMIVVGLLLPPRSADHELPHRSDPHVLPERHHEAENGHRLGRADRASAGIAKRASVPGSADQLVVPSPAGGPPDVTGALASGEVERALSITGGEARPASLEELAFLAGEQQRWARIIETTRVSVD
jgi:hypothetical protein